MKCNDAGAKTVAVLGLGEAGSLMARDLVRGGATVRGWDPDFHGDLSEIPLAASLAAAVDGADIVISVNWATVALDVAREALPPLLRRGMLYDDHNTVGPKLKEELAAIVEPSGAAFIDVAMMAPVPPLGMCVGMFVAGSGAEELAAFYRRFGTPVGFIGMQPGVSRGGVRFVNLELAGRVAVVTGGSSGFGLSAVRRFLEQGASVAFCARDRARVDAVTAELAATAGDRVLGGVTDILDAGATDTFRVG
jgi:hypothetical protein